MSLARTKRTLGTICLGLTLSSSAAAQFGPPPMAPPQSAPKKDPNAPETHAASGASDDAIPKTTTSEPRLPEDPLALPPSLKKRIGSTSERPGDREQGTEGPRTFKYYPPNYFEEKSGNYRFRTIFPIWAERSQPGDTASSYGLLYYRRRSQHNDADVLFPFVWKWREDQDRTTIIGPVGWHNGPTASDSFFAPFYFYGKRKDGFYLTIPPLLTHLKTDENGGRSIIGPGYCFWRGGQTCNPETADTIKYGVFPFYFAGKDERSRYELAPPLLHYYSYEELDQSWINIWGPYIRKHTPTYESQHVAPFYFHVWGPNEDHLTIPPLLFHYGHRGDTEKLLVTPLFIDKTGPKGERTFVTWGYARHRGRTQLDMITPFYWRHEDPDAKSETKLLFPFLYSHESPRESTQYFFPFYGHQKKYGLSQTWWVTPFFEHERSITGWKTNLYPFVFVGRDRLHSHTVVAPFFFDFVTPDSRATVGFPIYWRFQEGNTTSQLVLNTYYRERKLKNGLDWEFHFFPFFTYGETPNGHWWNVLYGLAGFTRSGAATKMRLFWVPIELSEDPK